ncbi:uncharacterized protein FIBRA_03305 [Fibroporia radiculosa]|uniref:Uncharacterized protein n=1 Tax=Fibroporia radiculosa TaxID=599839 RepID=J4I9J2_9APHY|nr:uncharacterized protein FIBRA_03305 [Fibroporia radiculosa]CCM01256.1 predicted protein [Fibroporia radiculosa]
MLSAEKAALSPLTWRRVPSTLVALFGITVPYQPPNSLLGAFLWRKRMLIECTFGLTVLESWEKALLLCLIYLILTLIITGLYKYAPQYAVFVKQRTAYYLFGPQFQGGDRGEVAEWVVRNITEAF